MLGLKWIDVIKIGQRSSLHSHSRACFITPHNICICNSFVIISTPPPPPPPVVYLVYLAIHVRVASLVLGQSRGQWSNPDGHGKNRPVSKHNKARQRGILEQLFVLGKVNRQMDGLVQDCSNSIANALELLQSYTKPSIWCCCASSQP